MYHPFGNVCHQVYTTNIYINGHSRENEWEQWKEKLGMIIHLPEGEEPLQPVIQLLVASLAPAQVYRLAHPAATGEDPFIDLLLIIPARCTTPFTELEPVLEIAGINHQKIACSLHNEGNVRDALKAGHLFYTLALRPENLLYDSGEMALPPVTAEALQALKTNLQQTVALYGCKAKQFEACANLLLQQEAPLALFMLQQAAELAMRGILIAFSGYDKKTHELRSLKKHLRRCAPQLLSVFPDNTGEETRLLTLLESAYLGARYNPACSFNSADACCLHQRVSNLLQAAERVKESVVQTLESMGKAPV